MNKYKLMLGTWARAFATAVITCYLTYEIVSWKILLNAGLASVLPIILRYLNTADRAYGRVKSKK